MPFDPTESAIVAEYARRTAGRLQPEEASIVDEYLRRNTATSGPSATTPQAIAPTARATMTPRTPGDVIDQIAARRTNPPKMANPPRLPSTPVGAMAWEGAKGVGQGIVGMIPGMTGKPDPNDPNDPLSGNFNAERSGVVDDPALWMASQVHGFLKRDAAMQQQPPAPTIPGKLVNAASVALPQVEAIAAPGRAFASGRAPTKAENSEASQAGGQLTGAMIAPKVFGAVGERMNAPKAAPGAPKPPGLVDFVRVHGKDRLAQSWFGRTAANAAEARRITQWVSDRALSSLDASPRSVGSDGAASVTGWGGDALHTQILRERELAGSNVDAAVATADTDGLRIDARDAVTKAYGDEIARLQRAQGGRAGGVVRGLQQEMKAKLSQLSQPQTRAQLVDAYRGVNQQLTDAVRENPAKATDPFMRAEGALRNELANRVKQTGGPSVAKAFDEYHLANKAYESYGPVYDSMRTGSLKDPFTGVQTSIIQRIAGGPRTRMKTIGVLDRLTPESTKAAMRGSTARQAVPVRPIAAAPATETPSSSATPPAPAPALPAAPVKPRINLLDSRTDRTSAALTRALFPDARRPASALTAASVVQEPFASAVSTAPAAPKPTAFDLVNGTQGETASGAYAKLADSRRPAAPKAPMAPRVFKAPSAAAESAPTPTPAPEAPRTTRTTPLEETVRPKAPQAQPATKPKVSVAELPPDRVAELRQQAKDAARRGQLMSAQRLNSQADRLVRERARTAGGPQSAAEAIGAKDTKAPIAPKPQPKAAALPSKQPAITGPASSRVVSDWSGVDPEKHPWRAQKGDTIAEGDVRGAVRSRFITPRRGPAYSIDLGDGKTAMIFEDRITEHKEAGMPTPRK